MVPLFDTALKNIRQNVAVQLDGLRTELRQIHNYRYRSSCQRYLAQAGISGVNPQRVQLWRRGREVAIFGGGNQATLDATTYFEFYGQRNDGKLDQRIYKGGAATQPHDLYSLYTDTAAYFLTWSATANGRRMAAVATTPGAPQATRLAQRQVLYRNSFGVVNDEPGGNVYQPWGEAGEGFLSFPYGGARGFGFHAMPADSLWAVARTAAAPPQGEVLIVGAWSGPHTVEVRVQQPGTTTERVLGTVAFDGYEKRLFRAALRSSDISGAGTVTALVYDAGARIATQRFNFRVGYVRYTFPQASRWAGSSFHCCMIRQLDKVRRQRATGPQNAG